jgi:Heterokaryon incompatibility protein (HET)
MGVHPIVAKRTDCLQLESTEMASGDEDFLCEACRKIDFQDLLQKPLHDVLQNPRQSEDSSETSELSLQTMRYSNGCKLCLLMFQGVPKHDMEKTFELRSYSFKKISYWARENNLNARDSVVLKIVFQIPSRSYRYPPDDVFCKLASDGSQGLYFAQPVQEIWDCARARLWLDTCVQCHESVCKQDLLRVLGMNLIDCENMVIVKAAQGMRWLALSYVWGVNFPTEAHAGYREGSSISLDIHGTVRDAISVTLQLGHRYLWVDEYCIDQNDDNHRNDQIQRMDQIYRGADLTIVAAAGENKMYGLPGVGSTKRKESKVVRVEDVIVFSNGPDPQDQAMQSTWFTRAW